MYQWFISFPRVDFYCVTLPYCFKKNPFSFYVRWDYFQRFCPLRMKLLWTCVGISSHLSSPVPRSRTAGSEGRFILVRSTPWFGNSREPFLALLARILGVAHPVTFSCWSGWGVRVAEVGYLLKPWLLSMNALLSLSFLDSVRLDGAKGTFHSLKGWWFESTRRTDGLSPRCFAVLQKCFYRHVSADSLIHLHWFGFFW